MARIEERLKGLEVAQARLDMRLQQDASKLDQLHTNMGNYYIIYTKNEASQLDTS